MKTSKMLVIDTENYAGNFEIELCTYVTAQYGDFDKFTDVSMVKLYEKEIKHIKWWKENIEYEKDEYSCISPCDIYETPNWVNDGNGGNYKVGSEQEKKIKVKRPAYLSLVIFVKEVPKKEILKEFMERAEKYCLENNIKLTGFRKIETKLESKNLKKI